MALLRNPNAFADYPLNKAGDLRKDESFLAQALAGTDGRLCLFRDKKPLVDGAGAVWLGVEALSAFCAADSLILFLGLDERGCAHFAAEASQDDPLPGAASFEDLRSVAARIGAFDSAVLGCAKSLYEWHARHRYCANCGDRSAVTDGGWRRGCASCGTDHFPRVDPVVIMLPVLGDRACVGRQSRFPPGMFSAFAGFIEPGESLEEACMREVKEEAGLEVTAVSYHSSQPWPFPSSLMIGLHCDVRDDALQVDHDEIEEAIWISKDEARAALGGVLQKEGRRIFCPPPLAIAHQLIKAWVER